MTALLVIFSVALAAIAALALLTQATLGVGVICIGILLAILARINQAGEHHKAVLDAIRQSAPAPPPPS